MLLIIPARHASTRFPGKPLAVLGGKTVIQGVWEQAKKARGISEVIVATDDERIAEEVQRFGGKAEMTDADHPSGTDRCAEVARRHPEHELVVNVQGDEPFIRPEQIEEVLRLLRKEHFPIATLARPIDREEALFSSHVVKVVRGDKEQALYFSRQPIPHLRDLPREQWIAQDAHLQHLGIYGYRRETLLEITELPEGRLEQLEKLEQLRWLEKGFRIGVGITNWAGIGIDTPEDLRAAEQFLLSQKEKN